MKVHNHFRNAFQACEEVKVKHVHIIRDISVFNQYDCWFAEVSM